MHPEIFAKSFLKAFTLVICFSVFNAEFRWLKMLVMTSKKSLRFPKINGNGWPTRMWTSAITISLLKMNQKRLSRILFFDRLFLRGDLSN